MEGDGPRLRRGASAARSEGVLTESCPPAEKVHAFVIAQRPTKRTQRRTKHSPKNLRAFLFPSFEQNENRPARGARGRLVASTTLRWPSSAASWAARRRRALRRASFPTGRSSWRDAYARGDVRVNL